jgi:hypothetical protein
LLGLGSHVGSVEPEGGDPGRIKPTPHLADLVSVTLQRENPTERTYLILYVVLVLMTMMIYEHFGI